MCGIIGIYKHKVGRLVQHRMLAYSTCMSCVQHKSLPDFSPLRHVERWLTLRDCLLCTQGPANAELYEGLLMLQHRGQDSAGMVTLKDSRKFVEHKANGLVKDVFNNSKTMDKLQGMLLTQLSVITQAQASHDLSTLPCVVMIARLVSLPSITQLGDAVHGVLTQLPSLGYLCSPCDSCCCFLQQHQAALVCRKL